MDKLRKEKIEMKKEIENLEGTRHGQRGEENVEKGIREVRGVTGGVLDSVPQLETIRRPDAVD
jgi:hypothetical protein